MEIKPQITQNIWLGLNGDTRAQLKKIFEIVQSRGCVIDDNKIISDGCTDNDLKAITLEKLQSFLGTTQGDLFSLFSAVVNRIERPNEVKEIRENAQKEAKEYLKTKVDKPINTKKNETKKSQ